MSQISGKIRSLSIIGDPTRVKTGYHFKVTVINPFLKKIYRIRKLKHDLMCHKNTVCVLVVQAITVVGNYKVDFILADYLSDLSPFLPDGCKKRGHLFKHCPHEAALLRITYHIRMKRLEFKVGKFCCKNRHCIPSATHYHIMVTLAEHSYYRNNAGYVSQSPVEGTYKNI